MKTFHAFAQAAQRDCEAARAWLERLGGVSRADIRRVFESVPRHRISELAIEFAVRMLELNQNRLLKLREDLS